MASDETRLAALLRGARADLRGTQADMRKLRERLGDVKADRDRLAAELSDARELLADILDPKRWEAEPPRVALRAHRDQLASWRQHAGTEPQP